MTEADKIRVQGMETTIHHYKKRLGELEQFWVKGILYTRKQLEKMDMKSLREIGNQIDAKDTSKEELIVEIIRKSD